MRVAELISLCGTADLMGRVLGDGSERSQSTRLGNALQNARDRVFAEWQIESAGRDAHSKAALYRLAEASDVPTVAAPAMRAAEAHAPAPDQGDFGDGL